MEDVYKLNAMRVDRTISMIEETKLIPTQKYESVDELKGLVYQVEKKKFEIEHLNRFENRLKE